MPRRTPIDPQGLYHVGSRGCYGQRIFRRPEHYELFLRRYTKVATKYGWSTYEWVLMPNHHHFVIELTNGGLSEGMRELHGWYSRMLHAEYGVTGQGHLVRHAFFARRLTSDAETVTACRYVSLNHARATGEAPHLTPYGGYPATIGLCHPQPFHSPAALLGLISSSPSAAQVSYRAFVLEGLDQDGHGPSPNDGVELPA
jgi:putative transposase